MANEQNIEFWKGSATTIEFRVVTGDDVEVTANASSGASSISVNPITQALSDGDKIYFEGGAVGTLDAGAVIGAVSLSLSALTGDVKSGDVGWKIEDISGYTAFKATFKHRLDDATFILQKTESSGISKTAPADGLGEIALTKTDTDLFTQALHLWDLWRVDSGAETPLIYGQAQVLVGPT